MKSLACKIDSDSDSDFDPDSDFDLDKKHNILEWFSISLGTVIS